MNTNNNAIEIVKFIIDNFNKEDNTILGWGLKLLKTCGDLSLIDRDSLNQLINIMPNVNDIYDRATLIEVIVASKCYIQDNNGILLDDKVGDTLDEYIYLLSENASTIQDASSCLNAFIISGVNKDEVFNKVARELDEKTAIKLLIGINEKWDKVPNDLETFVIELEKARRISYRSFAISSFLSIVHPLCSKYAHIHNVSSMYTTLISAIADWGWRTPDSTNYLVDRKIITKEEGRILERLGMLIMDDINMVLNPEVVGKLYYEFFNDKNPLDVMFTLPE